MKVPEGDAAWIGLLAYVVAYDAYALLTGKETLSSAYYRALAHPRRRWPTIATWVLLTSHLFRLTPRLDPISWIEGRARRN
jgi:hypothetical protein